MMPSIRPRGKIELLLLDRVALGLVFFFLLADVFGGAVRYYAVQFHLAWLPYLPHLLLGVAIVPFFLAYLLAEGVTSTYLTVFVLFGVGVVYGLLNLSNANQVLFGLWVLIAFLFGIVALPAIIRGWGKLRPYVLLLWVLAVAGVLINVFHQWPWVGLEYQVGATSIQASRLWHVGGLNIARLPGFSRASFNAAGQILVLALFLRVALRRRRWWIPMWILTGAAVVLTTSKAPIGVYLLFSAMWFFYRGAIRPSWRLIPIGAVCLDVLLPFSMLFIRLDWSGLFRSALWVGLAGSMVGRMQRGWPRWIRMTIEHGNAVLGRGVGGVGSATVFFEPALFNAADNIAIYLYGIFGVLGLVLLCVYAWKMSRIRADSNISRFLFFCGCVILVKGLTAGVMEGSATALVFGMSLRYVLDSPVLRVARQAAPHGQGNPATGQLGSFRTA